MKKEKKRHPRRKQPHQQISHVGLMFIWIYSANAFLFNIIRINSFTRQKPPQVSVKTFLGIKYYFFGKKNPSLSLWCDISKCA